ncbi:hypothetical protein [Psychroserpens sp. Hel_I_66]|uniref:hypothetical protein n=1 Tax=Psychroserpens sp. Hel_I_66 TaxID=1250004 RepID=UPI000A93EFCC|nr:hypothetical protein [Psychroserpens sp. Hel_I_66]
MKNLKILFSLIVLLILVVSCTPQALDDEQNNITDNIHSTGDDDAVDDGSKD